VRHEYSACWSALPLATLRNHRHMGPLELDQMQVSALCLTHRLAVVPSHGMRDGRCTSVASPRPLGVRGCLPGRWQFGSLQVRFGGSSSMVDQVAKGQGHHSDGQQGIIDLVLPSRQRRRAVRQAGNTLGPVCGARMGAAVGGSASAVLRSPGLHRGGGEKRPEVRPVRPAQQRYQS
jgi:hypothetical protein